MLHISAANILFLGERYPALKNNYFQNLSTIKSKKVANTEYNIFCEKNKYWCWQNNSLNYAQRSNTVGFNH